MNLLFIAAALLAQAAPEAAAPTERTTFRDHAHGYACEVPEGWAVVSDATVAEVFAGASGSSADALGFRAAFQPAAHAPGSLAYPYVLAQVQTYPQLGTDDIPTLDEMRSELAKISGLDVAAALQGTAGTEGVSGQLGEASFDPATRRFHYPLEVAAPDGATIRGEAVGYFGRYALIQLLFYARAEEWDALVPAREKFFNSFALTEEAALPPGYGTPSGWPQLIVMTVAGALAGALGMAFGIWRRRKHGIA